MIDSKINSIDDGELWNRFKDGDESAFSQIFQTYYRTLLRYGLKFHKDNALVEDCVQDLFIELWKNRENQTIIAQIKPYLFTCIRRKIIKETTKESYLKKLFVNIIPDNYDFEVSFSPENELISSETTSAEIAQIQTLLNKLPPRQKEVLYLMFYQDMSYEEIATVMRMNNQSARNLVHRAMKLLRMKTF